MHDDCVEGVKLASGCDACVTMICAVKPSCCASQWGPACVADVDSVCGDTSCGTTCAHSECTAGAKLTSGCDACATSVCDNDPYCCEIEWDSLCVEEVTEYCTTVCP